MISHARFGKLRLAQFRPEADIAELAGWEFMDQLWVGEAVGFSEWLRLESDPNVLRSLALDFADFPEAAASAVLQALDLPVRPGMTAKELRSVFGEPTEEHQFGADRVTYEFAVPGPSRYTVSCTVLKRGGLTYLVVMRPLPKGTPNRALHLTGGARQVSGTCRPNSLVKRLESWGAIIGLIGGLLGIFSFGQNNWDRFFPPEVEVLEARPVLVKSYLQTKDVNWVERGISLIVRVQTNARPAIISGIDVKGRLNMDFNDYIGFYGKDGDSLDILGKQFQQVKPYFKVNWAGWMDDSPVPIRLEPFEERFIRFTLLKPTSGTRGREINLEFVGSEPQGKIPSRFRTHPEWFDFFKIGFGEKEPYPQDIRDELKNGEMKISIRVGPRSLEISPEKIRGFKIIMSDEWKEKPVQYLFYDRHQ